jgi:hypothetical protein
MQVASDHPIDDASSVCRAVSERLAGRAIATTQGGWYDYASLQSALRDYNDNDQFVEMASQFYGLEFRSDSSTAPPTTPVRATTNRDEKRKLVISILSQMNAKVANEDAMIQALLAAGNDQLRAFDQFLTSLPPRASAEAEDAIKAALRDPD